MRELARDFLVMYIPPPLKRYTFDAPIEWVFCVTLWACTIIFGAIVLRAVDDLTAVTEDVGPGVVIGREHSAGYMQTTYISDGKGNMTPVMTYIPPSWQVRVTLDTGDACRADVTEEAYGSLMNGQRVMVTRGRTRILHRLIVTGIGSTS